MYRLPITTCVVLLLSACATAPEPPAPSAPPPPETRVAEPPPPAESDAQRQERTIKELAGKRVYFDSGSHAIKAEYRDSLKQVAEFLASAPQVSLELVGHAAEKGKANRALSQKRADAVKRALKELGVAESRLQAGVAAGERPHVVCREKKCRAENRRVDLVFRTPEAAK